MSINKTKSAFSDLYSAYAAGCLDPAFALLVETQSALRGDVREAIVTSEIIAAVNFEQTEGAALSDDALDRVFAAIDALEPSEAKTARTAAQHASRALEELIGLPAPLRDAAIMAAGETGWKFIAPGLRRLALNISDAAETELYRMDPGVAIPRHGHESSEFTLVVSGGFTDEAGAYGPGDLAIRGPADTHQPVADPDGPCIVLAVRDGGLRFQGVMGLVQRLMG